MEWISYQGKYQHDKTKIFAAAFCRNNGERIVLHISNYTDNPYAEKELIQDILFYFNQMPLTFGWYTTGIAVYDNKGRRIKGRDSDFFILHQRCLLYGLESPFEIVNNRYVTLKKESQNKHIDLVKIFEKPIIKENIFEGRYRTTSLDSVSSALLGISKYNGIDAGETNVFANKSVEEQKRYVRRDAELVMLLAQYNNCLVLRLMKVFAKYSEMDYYKICHTNVSKWYENKYQKMIERGECTLEYTPNYKLDKQPIGGGHHSTPSKGFFINSKVYELDVKGMYLTIVMNNNISFDTLNCTCCKGNFTAEFDRDTINTINEGLAENRIERKVAKYWTCRKRKGAFPTLLDDVLSDRDRYLKLLKEEKNKPNPNHHLIEEYKTHQIGAKLFANAGFGLFGNEYFVFSNYRVAECITGEGRRIHKQMETLAKQQDFEIVFGFTDSTFVRVKDDGENSSDKIKGFIAKCKEELGITVEIKNVFVNSIFYGKKNRFVAWTGSANDEPIVKGLDGMADSNPLWIRKWFKRTIEEIIINPIKRFETIPSLLKEAVFELEHLICKSPTLIEKELKFTQRLRKYSYQYDETTRAGIIANLLGKDKGEEIGYFETKRKDKVTNGKFSITVPATDSLNLQKYENILLDKLSDTLKIMGFDLTDLKLEILQKTLPINSEIYL